MMKNLFECISTDALMNVYFYLSTRDLVQVIGVCRLANHSIKQEYNYLPITSNTVREYRLQKDFNCEFTLKATGSDQIKIEPTQIGSTLQRSIISINLRVTEIHCYNPIWFQNVNFIFVNQSVLVDNQVKNNLASIMTSSLATNVSYCVPLLDYFSTGLPFPPNMKQLMLVIGDRYSDQYYKRTSTLFNSFPRNLTELVVIGNYNEDYLCSYIVQPGLVLKSLTIKMFRRNNIFVKKINCEELKIIHTRNRCRWENIFNWASYTESDKIIPKRLSIKCRIIDYGAKIYTEDDNISDALLLDINTTCSPLEELELFSFQNSIGLTIMEMKDWVDELTKLITSNKFSRLKRITLDKRFSAGFRGLVQIGLPYEECINGVLLKISEKFCDESEEALFLNQLNKY